MNVTPSFSFNEAYRTPDGASRASCSKTARMAASFSAARPGFTRYCTKVSFMVEGRKAAAKGFGPHRRTLLPSRLVLPAGHVSQQ
jgi:hypothetical protein